MKIYNLKLASCITSILLLILGNGVVSAQSDSSFAKSIGLFAYPEEGQSAEQQSKDDSECYAWSRDQTGYDPINPPETQVAQQDSGPDGSRARGALRGAAAGAVVDEVREDRVGNGNQINERYGDDHQGRQTGAIIGAARGGARSRRDRRNQEEAAEQQSTAVASAELDGFKNAFSACLNGRDYSVQ